MNNEELKGVVYLSQETYDRYKKEYEHLVNVERPAVQAALKEARAQGDLSENAEYDAARDRQGAVEGRISELEQILDNAKIIEAKDESTQNTVGIGTTVQFVKKDTNQVKEVTIMGTHDTNPFENKISNKSPLAVAMMGHVAGDVVEVDAQTKYMIEILSVKFSN
ncbi:transcription elongation factor GreA [Mycoplasma sp. 2045]|uniref:transcription elongation factor GreA n=1 Tax=unclassified Mycoplasma TaxID=2683645 RepID=UPI00211C95FF|nr:MULTISPECIES: transcription elongation factor GreA [unclassified Mycoplasma]MEA4134528.1 transcription elongation factor GreA [Mycoplasma sp. 2704]MEA4162751.1 transcription elongation factor GreA [Mycoplasma sp. 4404]MEA4190971.1 transcription elongation factor GreA [Mycoplasma sp. 2248]MEA4206323.1 transcription elongation factor GreA [Mycoplasma sp. 1199]MEA4333735.1 transcription elongation factor GreA [Mycoplasma sp. 1232]